MAVATEIPATSLYRRPLENPMTEEVAGPERHASPWPLLVALGVVVSELGVLFGVAVVAVAGLLVFVGSVAGVLTEAGYAASPWAPAAVLGLVLVAAGAALVLVADGVTVRGLSVGTAGAVAVVAAVAGRAWAAHGRSMAEGA